jgi:MoxR-like ATPase
MATELEKIVARAIYGEEKATRAMIESIISEINACFIERDELARLVLLAILSKEHIFMIGEPGVAKSEIARSISGVVKGARYFEYLINENAKYEDIFGAELFDAEGRPNERSVLNAHFFFADEIFKCGKNTAILNAFLQIMNERKFSNGFTNVGVPLITMIGAANEFPNDSSLEAFDDRLVLRYKVERIRSEEGLVRFARGDFKKSSSFPLSLTMESIDKAKAESEKVEIPDQVLQMLISLTQSFVDIRSKISDRKLRKAISIMKVAAYYNGRDYLDYSDLCLLAHVSWRDYEQRDRVKEKLHDVIYGGKYISQNGFKSEISIITERYEWHMSKLQPYEDILNFKREFYGSGTRAEEYLENLNYISIMLLGLKNGEVEGLVSVRNERLNPFIEQLQFSNWVAQQVAENLFVTGPLPDIMTPEMTQELVDIANKVMAQINRLTSFIDSYPTINEYDAAVIEQKNSGGAKISGSSETKELPAGNSGSETKSAENAEELEPIKESATEDKAKDDAEEEKKRSEAARLVKEAQKKQEEIRAKARKKEKKQEPKGDGFAPLEAPNTRQRDENGVIVEK